MTECGTVHKQIQCAPCGMRLAILMIMLAWAMSWPTPQASAQPDHRRRPNVLFIMIDDMNDWVNCLEPHYAGTIHTPNMDRLAARGRLFTNVHTAYPLCGPSRNALLLGRQPWNTGMNFNGIPYFPNFSDAPTIPGHFKSNGYFVAGQGKVFHQGPQFNNRNLWHEYPDFDRIYDSAAWTPDGYPLNGVNYSEHRLYPTFDWGPLKPPARAMYDDHTTDQAIALLQRKHEMPFFIAAGIFLPHIPLYAPQEFFDLYPLDEVQLPEMKVDDLDDVPASGRSGIRLITSDFRTIRELDKHSEAVQAYLACISYVDALVGRMIDALDSSDYADDTIIVIVSDHGMQLGEKSRWHKWTLWERSTRVPLIIAGPDVAQPGVSTPRPVSLTDLFRTLNDLCELPAIDELDGESLMPLLRDPLAERTTPAMTMLAPGHMAVRSERYRYIRYQNGEEELYDHRSDPHEWTNLARLEEYQDVKLEHVRWLPKSIVTKPPPINSNTHRWDNEAHKWVPKNS